MNRTTYYRRLRLRVLLYLLGATCLCALTSCAPGHYRSRQFHDLSQPGSSLHTTNVYKR